MTEQKIRGEPTPDDQKGKEQILLIHDNKKDNLRAISGRDKKGQLKTVPADEENQNSFLKIDNSSILETFYKNFLSQLEEPTRFRLFKIYLSDFDENKRKAWQLERLQKKCQPQNEKEMVKKQNEPEYRYPADKIDWTSVEKFGVTRRQLEEKGLLEKMQLGYKTDELVPIKINTGKAVVEQMARLSFRENPNGKIALQTNVYRKSPDLERDYFGYTFTKQDKENLLSDGNLGRVVDLKNSWGEVPSMVSIDPLTNEVMNRATKWIKIPEKIGGVELDQKQYDALSRGEKVLLRGLVGSESGTKYDAKVQYNAALGYVEQKFLTQKLSERTTLAGVKLTKKQKTALVNHEAFLLKGIPNKSGTGTFDNFVKADPYTDKPILTRFNPDSPEGNREIIIPNEIGQVQLTDEDQKSLAKGESVYLENMIFGMQEVSRFVKLDLETGLPMYANHPDEFEKNKLYDIPQKEYNHTYTPDERAKLQDGKVIHLKNLEAPDGRKFDSYVRRNPRTGLTEHCEKDPSKKQTKSKGERQGKAAEKKQETPVSPKQGALKNLTDKIKRGASRKM